MTDAESECWASAQRWHERCVKAEAEIERTREQLRAVLGHVEDLRDEITQLRMENAALRRALELKP